MPVPPGFVVPADALEAALADTAAAIRAVLARGEAGEDLAAVSQEAIALVRAADSGGAFPAEVATAYARLGDVPVAVRSSATAEDSEEASFAGQQETYLHVHGVDGIVRADPRLLVLVLHGARALLPRPRRARWTTSGWPWSCSAWSSPTSPACSSRSTRRADGATACSSRPSSGSARASSPAS